MIRHLIKGTANGVAIVLAAPMAAVYHVLALVAQGRRDDVFQGCTQLMSLLPGLPGDYLRRAFLLMTCRRASIACSIGFGTIFATPDVEIGEGVYIGPFCSIGHTVIGRDTMLGTGVHLIGGGRAHGTSQQDVPMRLQERQYQTIVIGEDCWIGNAAVVMADLGAHVVVGAAAVVTSPVAEWLVVAGNPARRLRDRRDSADDVST